MFISGGFCVVVILTPIWKILNEIQKKNLCCVCFLDDAMTKSRNVTSNISWSVLLDFLHLISNMKQKNVKQLSLRKNSFHFFFFKLFFFLQCSVFLTNWMTLLKPSTPDCSPCSCRSEKACLRKMAASTMPWSVLFCFRNTCAVKWPLFWFVLSDWKCHNLYDPR